MSNSNKTKIYTVTFVIVVLCICAAIAVAVLVGCRESEYDPSMPSPEYIPVSDSVDDGDNDTDFYVDTVPQETDTTILVTESDVTEEDITTTDESAEIPMQTPEYDWDWNLLLVNPWNPMPEGYEVEFVNLVNGHKVDSRAYEDLQAMMDDCRAAGLSPYICSSYRTYDYQKGLHDKQVNKYLSYGYTQEEAYAEASKWVAVPGTSEHHTGLALDIVASYYIVLDDSQEDMPEQQWLMEHSYKYGWILRYPNNKTDVTGIYYEPWHYRYVGKEAAKEMHDKGMCLEEYLQAE